MKQTSKFPSSAPNRLLSSKVNDGTPRKSITPNKTKGKGHLSMEIVTGKELVCIYFDPSKVVENSSSISQEWMEEQLYTAAAIVKEDTKNVTLRLCNDELVKVDRSSTFKISLQDDIGEKDILKLREFSEMSMLYTLRVRYERDEIYTFVGPILVSINPYKTIHDLYSEELMLSSHGRKGVCELNHK